MKYKLLLFTIFLIVFSASYISAKEVNVIAINYEYDFIVIDKGLTKGISDGDIYYIVKGGFKIGELQVRRAKPDLAACDITGLTKGANINLGESITLLRQPDFKTADAKIRWQEIPRPEGFLEPGEDMWHLREKARDVESTIIQEKQLEALKSKARIIAEEVAREKEELLVTFNFQNSNIHDVLRVLSRDKNLNIIASESIEGKVTASFQRVDVYRALDAILNSLGYYYIREDDIIKVMPLTEGEVNTRYYIFKPNYAKVGEIKEVLENMLSEKGKILLEEIVNQMMIIDTPSNLERIKSFVKQLDVSPRQVMIEAKIVDIRLTDEQRLGVDWRISRPVVERPVPTAYIGFDNMPEEAREGLSIFKFGTIGNAQLQATMTALREENRVDVLSTPSITTLNNRTAIIRIEDREAYREYATETTEFQALTSFEWKEKEIGISLEVTPHITSDNIIRLVVKPSARELREYRSAPIPGTDPLQIDERAYPVITTREATAEVMVAEGNTLVIGGLIKKDRRVVEKAIPVLSKIPVLGRAFKRESDFLQESELMIFITPRIIDTQVGARVN